MMTDATGLTLGRRELAQVEFVIRWQSDEAAHEEHFLARKVNPWRDILPPGMDEALRGAVAGDVVRETYIPGKLVPGPRPRKVAAIPRDCFRPFKLRGELITPRAGRFYPYGLLNAHPGIRSTDVRPAFRVLAVGDAELNVDFNHPLADRELDVEARVLSVYPKAGVSRNTLPDWIFDICEDGPGMQARARGLRTDFASPTALSRPDSAPDAQFYAQPRPLPHIDATAAGHLQAAYAALAKPGDQALDLMAGRFSHLPDGHGLTVTGLGLGSDDLAANPALTTRTEHDLNHDPTLPYPDAAFDLVLNSLSFEYLTDPAAVLAEVHRTLRPGGTVAVALSNRWFPEKATTLWTQLHDYERLALVLDHLLSTGFTHCATATYRNWPRPTDDPHIAQTLDSDPLLIATARKA